uniref:FAD-dependent oxidoreductase n=1 Tax=Candidatus Marithrix sp. Canyon 246 TaxID=1827136 RepID=UPI000AECBE0E
TAGGGVLMNYPENFDVIVIGGGHAGTEAALASAGMVDGGFSFADFVSLRRYEVSEAKPTLTKIS